MNKNKVVGIVLVVVAAALSYGIALSGGGMAEGLVGKAIWYLPYVAFVCGIRRLDLTSARNGGRWHR